MKYKLIQPPMQMDSPINSIMSDSPATIFDTFDNGRILAIHYSPTSPKGFEFPIGDIIKGMRLIGADSLLCCFPKLAKEKYPMLPILGDWPTVTEVIVDYIEHTLEVFSMHNAPSDMPQDIISQRDRVMQSDTVIRDTKFINRIFLVDSDGSVTISTKE